MIASDKSSKNRHKAAANNKKTAKPSFAEMNALITMFNKGRLADSEQLATKMTKHFAQDGFGWKILGAIRQQQGLIEPAFEALKIAAILLPNDSEAHYNLGNSFYDKYQLVEAVSSYKKSIEIDPRFAQAHYNLGSVLDDQGLFADAESCYKVALKINPDHAEMHFNLALMLYEQGRFSEAANYYQQALKIQPDFTAAHVNLGASLKALGKLREAESSYRKALIIKPDHADAYNNLGVVLKDLGDMADAESCYRKAISINLNYASAYNNLGILLKDTGQIAEAESCYMKALKIDPLRAVSHNNLAVLFREQGRLADSEVCCRNALKIKPNYADAFNNLGLALDSQGRLPEAEAAFEQALELEPNSVSVLSNFSVTLNTLSQLTRAEVYLLKALDLAPQFINAHINLCVNYLAQGRIQEAEDICIIALQIQPDCMGAQNNLLFSMNYSANYSAVDCLEKARQYGLVVASKVDIPFTSWQHNPHTKRLRVGLVSGDLRQHVVAYFLENLIQYIDSSSIELIAYPTTNREDEVTAKLKPHFSGWKSLVGLTDQAAAQLIHNDGLHILMDLSGHSAGNRLPIFAWKPAPLQVSWLGYFATTGMAAMDYFIADVVGVPELQQSQFVEKIKYLPETRLCFTAPEADIAVSPLPAFANKFITFGCFQNMAKVGDDVLDLWAEIMVALPNAKLRWQCKSFRDNLVAEELKQRLVKRGVDSHRITLLGSVSRDDYLTAHHEVDVILDTFPFTGGTTTCEALWMGVPTLSLAGSTLIARQGASILTTAGLCDWVTETKDEYLSKALSFCNDLKELTNLRAGLRAQVLASPLFDAPRFAKNMEKVLWEMWNESQIVKPKPNGAQAQNKLAILASVDETSDIPLKLHVEVVSATRCSELEFWSKSALGLSLKRHLKQDDRLSVKIAFENSRGLSDIFNDCIDEAENDAILVFIHDDVWIDEANFVDTVIDGLKQFDVIGVAGNIRRLPNQPNWAFIDSKFTWDDKANLSGRIGHSKTAFGVVDIFGAVPAECELLDGVFLATKKSSLNKNDVRFDPQFDFHFYDMDFCRSAKKSGLTLGTWLISLTHQSSGDFSTKHWLEKYRSYLNKWEAPLANNNMIYSEDGITQTQQLQQAMNDVLQMALQHQSAGNIEQAAHLYLEIIDIQPKHAEANHNLGVIEADKNGALSALPRLEMAVQAKPEIEQYWVSYIDALMQSGAADTAADAIEVGKKYGLRNETAQMLATEFVKELESKLIPHQYFGDASQYGIHIHQIYYSEQTRLDNDSGFIGLDNLANQRSDWREYWPIRNYLLTNSLNDDDYYGFLSPKFKAKTNLDAATVNEFVRTHAGEADVLLFSPFFDQGAYHLNLFEQGAGQHQDIMTAFKGSVAMIAPKVDLVTLVMDSRNIVFCNYIVAKSAFWKVWLENCELIFAEAEQGKSALAVSLNAGTNHDGGVASNKVFVIERIASLMLSTQRSWKVKAYNPTLLPYSNTPIAKYSRKLLQLDGLKITSVSQEYSQFLSMFLQVRQLINEDLQLELVTQEKSEIKSSLVSHQYACDARESKSICPVCDITNVGFNALPSSHRDNALKHGYAFFGQCEMTALDTYSCFSCGASDRERLYAYWIELQLNIKMLTDKSRIIHFAPEWTLSNKLKTLNFNNYYTADLMMVGCDYQVDMMYLPFSDESYDFFICSHVLEHVESDDRAIAELYRIMKKGGYGILMAPIVVGLENTQEDSSVKDEAGRWKFYGQNDHVRLYAHDDYVKKIQSHGFYVEQLGEEYFGEAVFHSLGLKKTSILYVVTK